MEETKTNRSEEVLYLILSSTKEKKLYNLRQRLDELLIEENNPLIKEHFPFDRKRGYSMKLNETFTGMLLRGAIQFAIINDYFYTLSKSFYELAEQAKESFTESDKDYLTGLGRKLS